MTRFPRSRRPTHPGEILREDYMSDQMTQRELADKTKYEVKAINRLVNGRTSVTAPMALALGEVFNTTPEFWLNLQNAVDLFDARKEREKERVSLPHTG